MEELKQIEDIIMVLKDVIDHNGPEYITDKPFQVYKKLLKSAEVDRRTAAALLQVFVSGLVPCSDKEKLSSMIQTECSLNASMSDRLSAILSMMYSEENRNEWSNRTNEGLFQFLKEDFSCNWEGFAVWDAGNGTVDCHYEAKIVLKPTAALAADKELADLLAANPFTAPKVIHELFFKRLERYLDSDFEDYCTCDDYYQPVVEDYGCNLKSNLEHWCSKNGFEFISCDGDGYDEGYQPKYRRGGW